MRRRNKPARHNRAQLLATQARLNAVVRGVNQALALHETGAPLGAALVTLAKDVVQLADPDGSTKEAARRKLALRRGQPATNDRERVEQIVAEAERDMELQRAGLSVLDDEERAFVEQLGKTHAGLSLAEARARIRQAVEDRGGMLPDRTKAPAAWGMPHFRRSLFDPPENRPPKRDRGYLGPGVRED